jgi:hypothetical protein
MTQSKSANTTPPPAPATLHWEDVEITTGLLNIDLRWGSIRIGLDMQYFRDSRQTGVSAYLCNGDRWTDDVMVPGALMPLCEPRRDQMDYLFDAISGVVTNHFPGTVLVRSTYQVDHGESLRTNEPNPGEFEFTG